MSGAAQKAALSGYRQLRRLKNRLLNRIDDPVVILIYHRVIDLAADPQLLAVSPGNFRTHMRLLKDNFHLVRFEEDWSGLKGPAVAVTFDDGYADNALKALPILEEMEVPATFFVSTGTLGTRQEFWWDELERIVLGGEKRPAEFRLDDPEYERAWPTLSGTQCQALYEDLQRLMGKVGPLRREGWAGQLRKWAGLDRTGREIHRPLSENELKRLADSQWATVGAHTVTHTPLSTLSEDEQLNEIVLSKEHLERITGRKVEVFSYPFGRKVDYTRTSVRICREAGFLKSAANFPGQAHRWTDRFQIPRQLVRNWDGETFAAQLRSFWT